MSDENEWVHSALCRQTDPELWFPEKHQRANGHQAKQICQTCPVQQPCLEQALARNERFGIWGGLNFETAAAWRRDELRTQHHIRMQEVWSHGTEAGAKQHHRRGTPVCRSCANAARAARQRRDEAG